MHLLLKLGMSTLLAASLMGARTEDNPDSPQGALLPTCGCYANGVGFFYGSTCGGSSYSQLGAITNDTISCSASTYTNPCPISGSVTVNLTACDQCTDGIITSGDSINPSPGPACTNASKGTDQIGGSSSSSRTVTPTRNALCDSNCGWRIHIVWWSGYTAPSCSGSVNEVWDKAFLCHQ